jgi:arabinogalactan endo-1,4-beta-galactosidase
MMIGLDASTHAEILSRSPHYRLEGREIEPLAFLHDENGARLLRLRLWVDPYDELGHPYGGGTDDFPTFRRLAKMGLAKGYSIMLDLHFSDFWCDPGKQNPPKAWASLPFDGLRRKVGSYAEEVFSACAKEGIDLAYAQIGNEITNGFLWPAGRLEENPSGGTRLGYERLSLLLKEAIAGARRGLPQTKIILHLERSGDARLHEEFFSEMERLGVGYDAIGLSYYPYWHGPFAGLWANVDNLRKRFRKEVLIVETGYGWTLKSPYPEAPEANAINRAFIRKMGGRAALPYPLSPDGQRRFLKRLLREGEAHGISAIVYWEPLWLPSAGVGWATEAGERYLKEEGKPTWDEWGNQCLFGYDGEATPAFSAFKVSSR